jgi:hypothetical protein
MIAIAFLLKIIKSFGYFQALGSKTVTDLNAEMAPIN